MPLRLPVIAATLALLAQAALAQVAVPPDPAASAAPARVTGWRHSNGETTRIVLDLDGPAPFRLELARGLARVRLPGAVSPALYRSFGGEVVYRARVYQDEGGAVLEAEVSWRAGASAFLLREPDRVVLDVTVPAEAPPPPGLAPDGITFETALASTDAGPARNLHLARVDPARFQPRVLSAPWGAANTVFELAEAAGAAAAINGGYFDPASSLAVDLVVSSGLLRTYGLGYRPAIAFRDRGAGLAYPRGRLMAVVPGAAGEVSVNVSAVNPVPRAGWVTAFAGDGFVPVGAPGFVTLVVANGVVLRRVEGPFTPGAGELTLSLDPTSTPFLDLQPGSELRLVPSWTDASWDDVADAVAAGPTLVRDGVFAVDAATERFDTRSNLWRATRQSAIGLLPDGRYLLAMLEHGTPEDMARALVLQGVRDALRLDSGTSSALYLQGGMAAGLWGRPVANAIAFLPR